MCKFDVILFLLCAKHRTESPSDKDSERDALTVYKKEATLRQSYTFLQDNNASPVLKFIHLKSVVLAHTHPWGLTLSE